MHDIKAMMQKVRETFDPGGNLPEDCAEWASAHELALDGLALQIEEQERELMRLRDWYRRWRLGGLHSTK